MKTVIRAIIVSLLLSTLSLPVSAIDFFKGTYPEALEKANKENIPILLYFTAKWCGPCRYMSKYIFVNDEVHRYTTSNYIALSLDIDTLNNRSLYSRYAKSDGISVPVFLIIDGKEQVLKKHDGSMKLHEFINFLKVENLGAPLYVAKSDSTVQKNNEKLRPPILEKFMYNSFHNNWKLGVRVGTNFSSVSGQEPVKYDHTRLGFTMGVFFEREFKRFFIQPGISFSTKGGKNRSTDDRISLSYVEIPVNAGVELFRVSMLGANRPIRINITPYYALAVSDHKRASVNSGNGPGNLSRHDYGVKTGISVVLGSFESALGYDWGLHNVSTGGTSLYNRTFCFSIAMVLGR